MSVITPNSGYTVKYTPLPIGDPSVFAVGNSFSRRDIFDRISFTSSKNGYSTGLFLHGVCAVRAAESVWRDGGVAGEAEEGRALGGTHLVDGSALVVRGGDLPLQGSRRRCSLPLLLAWGWVVVSMGR